jgi:hypothetical protein
MLLAVISPAYPIYLPHHFSLLVRIINLDCQYINLRTQDLYDWKCVQ